MSRRRAYTTWWNMHRRCRRDTYLGITVCPRWSKFENFYADMGDPPYGRTLERKNNAGDYTPANCRWATPREQASNTRRNVMVEHAGEIVTVAEASRRSGIGASTLYARERKARSCR